MNNDYQTCFPWQHPPTFGNTNTEHVDSQTLEKRTTSGIMRKLLRYTPPIARSARKFRTEVFSFYILTIIAVYRCDTNLRVTKTSSMMPGASNWSST